jgi:methionine sulfoxide reductase heme-binding subunit
LPPIPAALSAPALGRLRALAFALALLPLARLVLLGFRGRLGANPVEFVTRSLGTWALVLLCVTLAITPLRLLTGASWWLRLRRMLGLFCFFYATLHVLAYVWLDHWFDVAALLKDILKRPYITVGFVGYLCLVPLAATSTSAMVRRLGGRNWQRLHRVVYVIAVLTVLHFVWQRAAKNNLNEPLIYAAVLAVLLGFRVIRRWRQGSVVSPAKSDSMVSRSRTQ